jgi:two-component system NtrC family response regulator
MNTDLVSIRQARRDAERVALLRALEAFEWNISRAAPQLGVDRLSVYRLMRKHGIKRPAKVLP